ncbi:ion transporter [Leptothoe kymatousa]|uniref:BK channel n=1 Tax=Leptothoe kymatousa TAU-MAC 1615 TaxID=2364775 RepID=A0ABS5XZQ2_9CYAN|nr:ion transporter [Leptothoe kymatousa]MBT9311033.1 potassium channel protein [Leptothoe kymatousa TAU-MAC 1615]
MPVGVSHTSRFKDFLDRFIHAPQTEIALVAMILLSVALVVLEVVLETRGLATRWVTHGQAGLTSIFICELSLRYWVARKKRRFWRNYWLDILAVMPMISAFRLLRLLRILRLLRAGILLNRSLGRLSSAIATSLGLQIGVFMIIGLIVLTGGLATYLFEAPYNPRLDSLPDAMWWSFLSLVAGEPIGGDPQTDIGKVIALMVMMGGLTTFAVFTGVVSAVMMRKLETFMDFKALEIDELREHIVICGWNRGGHLIVEELLADGDLNRCAVVIVVENTEEPFQELKRLNQSQLYFYPEDYTKIDILETVGITYASRAILLADATHPRTDQDRDARTVLAALTIEKLNPSIYTCAQLLDRRNDVQLKLAGVDDVIVTEEVSSHLIATSARNQGSVEALAELLTVQSGNQIYEISVPSHWVGQACWSLSQHLKQQSDALLLALESTKNNERITQVNPPADLVLEVSDRLIIIARQSPTL